MNANGSARIARTLLLHGDVPFNDIKITLQPQDIGVLYTSGNRSETMKFSRVS